MEDEPLYLNAECFQDFADIIKALFTPDCRYNVRNNRNGNMEYTYHLEGVETEFDHDEYDKLFNKYLVETLEGLEVVTEGKMSSSFRYNGKIITIKQFINHRGDLIVFLFTLLS